MTNKWLSFQATAARKSTRKFEFLPHKVDSMNQVFKTQILKVKTLFF